MEIFQQLNFICSFQKNRKRLLFYNNSKAIRSCFIFYEVFFIIICLLLLILKPFNQKIFLINAFYSSGLLSVYNWLLLL